MFSSRLLRPVGATLGLFVLGVAVLPGVHGAESDPADVFRRAYGHNFDLSAVASIQLRLLKQDARPGSDQKPDWELVTLGMQGEAAWYEICRGEVQPFVPPSGGDSGALAEVRHAPLITAYWCDGNALYTAPLNPPGSWQIAPVGGRSEVADARRLVLDTLRQYGFRPHGVLFPPESGASYQFSAEDLSITVRFPHGGHYFRYYLENREEFAGLPREVHMLNHENRFICKWRCEGWHRSGETWLPAIYTKEEFLPEGQGDFQKVLPTVTRRRVWRLLSACIGGELDSRLFTPAIPEGVTVVDSRFGPRLTYKHDSRRTQRELLEMAEQEQIRTKLR